MPHATRRAQTISAVIQARIIGRKVTVTYHDDTAAPATITGPVGRVDVTDVDFSFEVLTGADPRRFDLDQPGLTVELA